MFDGTDTLQLLPSVTDIKLEKAGLLEDVIEGLVRVIIGCLSTEYRLCQNSKTCGLPREVPER